MARKLGLFTRVELQSGAPRVAKVKKAADLPVEHCHKLGVRGVRDMNPDARSPDIPPAGSDCPDVYILGDAPDVDDDNHDEPFVGRAGRYLKSLVPDGYRIRWNNVVRTLPPRGRPPTQYEIECFRPSLEEDIARSKPTVIVGLGPIPLEWFIGDCGGITLNRGRRYPVQVLDHKCWFYPVHHPAYILRLLDSDSRGEIPGEEWERIFKGDIRRVFDELDRLEQPIIDTEEDLLSNIECIEGDDIEKAVAAIESYYDEKIVGFDIETNRRRPYEKGAKVLSFAMGTSERSTAIALDHPQARWKDNERAKLLKTLNWFVEGPNLKVAHNLSFELEWMCWLYGLDVLRRGAWGDTMLQAYILDQRSGGFSLNFLHRLYFGLKMKAASTGVTSASLFGVAVESESQIDRKKLEFTRLRDVLKYNGGDTKSTVRIYRRQRRLLKERDLLEPYYDQVRRTPTLVTAQFQGIYRDHEQVKAFQREYIAKERKIEKEIAALDVVAEYEARFGTFSPSSTKHVAILLKDVMGRKEGQRKRGGYSTDKKVLEQIKHPVAEKILALRLATKLRSTYIDPLDPESENTVVFADGKLHTNFNQTQAATGRLSSDDPNMQNFPKRKHAEMRKMIVAPDGFEMLCADYGQIEARVIGCASRDKTLCDALWTDFDIHMVWAEKIVERYDKEAKARYGKLDAKGMKAFRSDVKNQMVFPAFYGAQVYSISRSLGMPEKILAELFEEFWEQFSGVRSWQRDLKNFYKKHLYVETLTKRRRYGPLNENMIINSPIQGSASDIVVDAMNRLSERAQDEKIPWLSPILNVHDDLTFYVPKSERDWAIKTIAQMMVDVPYDWVNVPISIEMSIGPNWYQQDEVGTFRSDQLLAK